MKILKIFESRPGWQHADPARRATSIASDDVPDDVLLNLLRSDDDPVVRAAVLARLHDAEVLTREWQQARDEVALDIARRIAVVIEPETLARLPPALLESIVRSAEDVELRIASLGVAADEAFALRILEADNHRRVHQAALDHVESETALDAVLKRFRNRDKTVQRGAREKLGALKARAARDQAAIAALEQLQAAISAHAAKACDEYYHSQWQLLTARARELTDVLINDEALARRAAELRSLFEADLARCETSINDWTARNAAAVDALQTLHTHLEHLETDLPHYPAGLPERLRDAEQQRARIDHERTDAATLRAIDQTIERLAAAVAGAQRWLDAAPAVEAALAAQPLDAAALGKLVAGFSWPEPLSAPPLWQQAMEAAAARREAVVVDRERSREQRERAEAEFGDKLGRLGAAIEGGKTRAAGDLQRHLTRRLGDLPRDHAHRTEYARLTSELRKLRDWQEFAAVPKRTALCEQMEALTANESLQPQARMDAIADLQAAWKALGRSDTAEEQGLWQRFQQAGEQAWLPCKAWLDAQQAQREANLASREALSEQLETFMRDHDWTRTDWKGVTGIIQQSKKAFRQYEDVPRAAQGPSRTRFWAAIDALQARVKAEETANLARKQAMIDELQALLADEAADAAAMVERAKRLQQDWKAVGITERRADQKLWKRFRAACDAVFARRDQDREVQNAAMDDMRKQANAIVTELANMDVVTHDARRVTELKAAFDAIEKPGAKARDRLEQALAGIRNLSRDRKTAESRARLTEMQRQAGIIARVDAGDTDATAELDAGDIALSPTQAAVIGKRLAAATAGLSTEDQATNLDTAHRLCIDMEILAGIESPPDDAARRLARKVERLNESMKGARNEPSPVELLEAWYGTGALPEDADRARFDTRLHTAFELALRAA